MKSLLLLFLISLLFGCGSKEMKISEKNKIRILKESSFVDKVKSIKEEETNFDFPTPITNVRHIYYNKYGLITKSVFDNHGIKNVTTYEYDDRGNLIEQITNDDGLIHHSTYKYDDIDRLIETEDNYDRTERKWNDKGDKCRINQYDLKGNLEYETDAFYDSKGNPVSFVSYKPDKSLNMTVRMEYNDMGKMIAQTYINADGSLNRGTSWKYDKMGNEIAENHSGNNGVEAKTFRREYKFDSTGNWIEQITYKFGVKHIVVKRTYEYYD